MPRITKQDLIRENEALRKELTEAEERWKPKTVIYPRNGVSPFEGARLRLGQIPLAMRHYNHSYHPGYYKDPFEEYFDLTNRVTMWDVGAAERQVEITGSDATAFVQMLTTRDMSKCRIGKELGLRTVHDPDKGRITIIDPSLAPCDKDAPLLGQCKYSFLTLPDGGIYNDPVIVALDKNQYWISLADTDVLPAAQMLCQGLRLAGHKMDIHIKEPDVAPFQIQGPLARAVMRDLLGEVPSYTNENGERNPIKYYWYKKHFKEFDNDLFGIEFVVASTGYSAEVPYEIYVIDATQPYGESGLTNAEQMWLWCWEAGAPSEISVIGPCHIRRIEARILALGRNADIWWDVNPFEVLMGYAWMVDMRNPDNNFIGRQALEQIKARGVSRKLVGFDIDDDDGSKHLGAYIDGSMPHPFPVFNNKGVPIGKVTSACYSPYSGKNIGLAMLDVDYADIGTEHRVETPLGMLDAMTVATPHRDPDKTTPKQ